LAGPESKEDDSPSIFRGGKKKARRRNLEDLEGGSLLRCALGALEDPSKRANPSGHLEGERG